jgi:Domain of unknown function (DUF4157)
MNVYAELKLKTPERTKAVADPLGSQQISTTRPRNVEIKRWEERLDRSSKLEALRRLQALVNRRFGTARFDAPMQGNEGGSGLPAAIRTDIENRADVSMQDVVIHRNSVKPAQLQALAYAKGVHIYLAPGQEQLLSHEAWHVAQHKQGRVRPTMHLQGMPINGDSALEREAENFAGNASTRAVRPLRRAGAQPNANREVAQRYLTYSNGEIMSHKALHAIERLVPEKYRPAFISAATAQGFENALLPLLTTFNLEKAAWDLISQAAVEDGGAINPWWKLDSKIGREREEMLETNIEVPPEIDEKYRQAVISQSSFTGARPPSTSFRAHKHLLAKIGAAIGKYDTHSLVLGADKDLLYPFVAAGSKKSTLVSTDGNSPYRRTIDLMTDAGVAYPLSPSVVNLDQQECSVHVTSGTHAHSFHLCDMLYGEFFKKYTSESAYDFILDKTSHLGTEIFDLSRFVQALKAEGYWVTDFKYLDRNQAGMLKLLGLEDVTGKIITPEEARSFSGAELHIYKKVSRLPSQWIDVAHGWYGRVMPILEATPLGRSHRLAVYSECEDDLHKTRLSESRLIFQWLRREVGEESRIDEMLFHLRSAYILMSEAVDNIDRSMI